ncbi:hypothetical protein [Chitinimonas koreensis]|uniref:hypothetical protein n=1 Tax=Chitinimonas koreensis TaxID=356302 RepID=UPI0004139EED|nr:hypothetical protein [Chitinimonas koreensis]QNM98126.1 hypothetical protein H9L41_07705 [Chitinimonas koreensis]
MAALLLLQAGQSRAEIDQVAALLDDAIGRLGLAFGRLDALIASQGALVQHAIGGGAQALAGPLAEVAAQVRRETEQAVQALQFQDLSAQLLARLAERIDGFAALAELLRLPGPDAEAQWRAVEARFEALERRTVAQSDLAGGDIELF